eukprot:c12102_g1_i2.p1 GENE.c12102_g1_i2~~c12102_g1_i2.p1  ORF type:complete len:530 (+),score=125.96 c12102_g1_i2:43-1632(+)
MQDTGRPISALQLALFNASSNIPEQPYAEMNEVAEDAKPEAEPESTPLYVGMDVELQKIDVLDQCFSAGVTIGFFWRNPDLFTFPNAEDKSPATLLLKFLASVYNTINERGNDAWEIDPHVSLFQKLHDPKQGDTWWRYCYYYKEPGVDPMTYIDLFLFLRTSAILFLEKELKIAPEQIPDVFDSFLTRVIGGCDSMKRIYLETTTFTRVMHSLSHLSKGFTDLFQLNREILAGNARLESDIFANIIDQDKVAWPQLCFYPATGVLEFVWENSWTGERIQARFRESMELQDYPLDRQLLSLRPKPAWSGASLEPFEGVRPALQNFMTYSVAPDLMSYSQWSYFDGVALRRPDTESGTNEMVAYSMRVERLIMPHVASVFLPQFVIVFLAQIALILDPEDVFDRITLILTLLLTSCAMYIVVKQGIPHVPYITLLEKYISASILLLATMTCEAAVVTYLEKPTAHLIDYTTVAIVGALWVVPHVCLLFGRFRRSWKSVYESQTKQKSQKFVSSSSSPEHCVSLQEKLHDA